MDISPDMQSLLQKLDALQLTDGERAAFGQLLGAEEEADVEGFQHFGSGTGDGSERGAIVVQGFNLIDTFPISVKGQGGPPRHGVVDHKADD